MNTEDRTKAISDVKVCLEDLRKADRDLRLFEKRNWEFVKEYRHLQDMLKEAKDYLAEAMLHAGVDAIDDPQQELMISYYRSDRGEYDAEKLPPDVRDNPEVTRLVAPKENVERAVKVGWLSRADAEYAWNQVLTKPTVKYKRTRVH